MHESRRLDSVSRIYAAGLPINLALELSIHFLAVLPCTLLVLKAVQAAAPVQSAALILLAIYTYPLAILVLAGVATRLLPKPQPGWLRDEKDKLKFQVLSALNKFIRRTTARWALVFPFPAYYFYWIAGARIDKTAFQSSPDSLPDPYLVSIGKHVLLGWNCAIFGHCSPDSRTTLIGRVEIGDHVLIGEGATVWPNVRIGSNAIVQSRAVVYPYTIIPSNEIWGGIPARKIRDVLPDREVSHDDAPDTLLHQQADTVSLALGLLDIHHGLKDPSPTVALMEQGLDEADVCALLRRLDTLTGRFYDLSGLDLRQLALQDLHPPQAMRRKRPTGSAPPASHGG